MIAAVLLVLLQEAAPADAAERTQVVATVDARIELLAAVQLLAGYEATGLLTRHPVAYVQAVHEWFDPFREHDAPRRFAALWPKGFAFDAPVAVVLHLGPPPGLEVRAPIPDEHARRAGSRGELEGFLETLRAFARDTECAAFFEEERELYAVFRTRP